MNFPNVSGKTLADAQIARAEEAAFINKRNQVIAPAARGQMPFIVTAGDNKMRYDYAIVQGNFCQTTTEIDEAKVRVVSFKDVFDTWKRFSHSTNTAPPANPSELTAWVYDEATDTITSTLNSATLVGFVSRTQYSDWELEVYLSSINGDDDTIGVVLGFMTDDNGVEHSLTALRSCGGSGFVWRVVVDHYNARSGISVTTNFGLDQAMFVKWGNGNYGATAAAAGWVSQEVDTGWDNMQRVKLHVKRVGDVITCKTSDFEFFDPTMSYIPQAEIVVDLATHPETQRFMGKSAYGYCAQSQHSAKFEVIQFIGDERVIYDVANHVVHVDSGSGWAVAPGRSLVGDLGSGRMLYNRYTGKLFYVEAPNEVYHLNGVPMP